MKRFFVGVVILGAAGVLGGCPVYPSDSRYGDSNCDACCTSGNCAPGYSCDPQGDFCAYVPGDAGASGCSDTRDCPGSLTCGSDGACHSGDCTQWGCPTGSVCELAGGSAQCSLLGGSVDGSSFEDARASDATPDDVDASPGDAMSSSDASSTDGGSVGGLCNANADCGGAGSKCIDGACTPQNRLCSDGTQCLVAGDACVDGVCLPRCSAASPGPTGYACDFNRGILSVNPSACKTSAQCHGGAVCVEEHCVAPCAALDAGAQCTTGLVCVNGGCIPDEQAQFACQNDGQTGGMAKTCDGASVCLHGDCYAACHVSDAGSCVDPADVCKAVTVTKGTFFVCAPPANLGNQCNAAVGSYCPSAAICIDGTCQ